MFTFNEVVSTYTRQQAIEDGALIPIDARTTLEAGIARPVACSAALWSILNPTRALEAVGQSLQGRLWDLLSMFRFAVQSWSKQGALSSSLCYPCFFLEEKTSRYNKRYIPNRPTPFTIKATIGPDDHGKPTITLMLDSED